MVKDIDGQITMFDIGQKLTEVVNCGNCTCQHGPSGPCEHWERCNCPEAAKRTEPNPDTDIHSDKRWHERWCVGCIRYLPDPGTNCHSGKWRGYEQHRYMCPSYMKSTCVTEMCLKYPITVYKSDGSKFCAFCEANGCEECYTEFMKRMEEDDE